MRAERAVLRLLARGLKKVWATPKPMMLNRMQHKGCACSGLCIESHMHRFYCHDWLAANPGGLRMQHMGRGPPIDPICVVHRRTTCMAA